VRFGFNAAGAQDDEAERLLGRIVAQQRFADTWFAFNEGRSTVALARSGNYGINDCALGPASMHAVHAIGMSGRSAVPPCTVEG
jgi:hypothetical protein